ncbi:hypothetical protein [Anoxybacteroides tepidamans]|uniref:hypothetical protein n=1 Tax=Anoxybacteroides tepidamans TaxID=265948 RepID=UPI000484A47C|nr:hypothetical protein [Anoxybacillus tepidamans]
MAALIVSLFLAVALTVGGLYTKAELERKFNRRKKLAFLHAVNVLIISAAITYSYCILSKSPTLFHGKQFFYVYLGAVQLLLPIYAFISVLIVQNGKREKKYTTSEDKKVLYIKEEYLAKKRQDRHYHSKTS